jgi:DNA-binding beta-propeller fold protein YncE
MKRLFVSSVVFALSACGGTSPEPIQIITTDTVNNSAHADDPTGDGTPNNSTVANNNTAVIPAGLALLGDNAHTLDAVDFTLIAGAAAGLRTPRDLEFHPDRPTELWILNLDDNSTVVIDNPNQADQSYTRYAAAGKDHFMAKPSAFAFSDNGNFASAQEEDQPTQGNLTPADFMGPTLWTSDRGIYDGGHGGHLDMLHNSPNGAGIAWESGNRFWVVDGYHQSITMYDFNRDHGPGGSDHTDGDVARYVEGEIGYVGGVPSHIEFDQTDKILYIADTGNNRIATLDPSVGEMGGRTQPNYDGGAQYAMNGGLLETWVEGTDAMLEVPSGLEIADGIVYVSDNKLSRIVAIDKETGALIDYLDLAEQVPTGGLMGMAIAGDGSIYAVDAVNSQIIRIAAKDSGTPQ